MDTKQYQKKTNYVALIFLILVSICCIFSLFQIAWDVSLYQKEALRNRLTTLIFERQQTLLRIQPTPGLKIHYPDIMNEKPSMNSLYNPLYSP